MQDGKTIAPNAIAQGKPFTDLTKQRAQTWKETPSSSHSNHTSYAKFSPHPMATTPRNLVAERLCRGSGQTTQYRTQRSECDFMGSAWSQVLRAKELHSARTIRSCQHAIIQQAKVAANPPSCKNKAKWCSSPGQIMHTGAAVASRAMQDMRKRY